MKNDPRGLQKQPRGNVRLAWPSPIHPLLMPLWNKDYVVLECGVIAALEHRTLWCSGVHYLPTSLYNCQSI